MSGCKACEWAGLTLRYVVARSGGMPPHTCGMSACTACGALAASNIQRGSVEETRLYGVTIPHTCGKDTPRTVKAMTVEEATEELLDYISDCDDLHGPAIQENRLRAILEAVARHYELRGRNSMASRIKARAERHKPG